MTANPIPRHKQPFGWFGIPALMACTVALLPSGHGKRDIYDAALHAPRSMIAGPLSFTGWGRGQPIVTTATGPREIDCWPDKSHSWCLPDRDGKPFMASVETYPHGGRTYILSVTSGGGAPIVTEKQQLERLRRSADMEAHWPRLGMTIGAFAFGLAIMALYKAMVRFFTFCFTRSKRATLT